MSIPTRRGRLGCFSSLLLVGVAIAFLYAGLTPWALRMGGRSTLDELWDGYGEVHASNGGRYVLYTHLQGGLLGWRGGPSRWNTGLHRGMDNLHGSAELCTASGATHTFRLTGIGNAWWRSDGAPTKIRLTDGTPVPLPPGWVVALQGNWRGPALELSDPDDSFTEAFTPSGEISRTERRLATSPAIRRAYTVDDEPRRVAWAS